MPLRASPARAIKATTPASCCTRPAPIAELVHARCGASARRKRRSASTRGLMRRHGGRQRDRGDFPQRGRPPSKVRSIAFGRAQPGQKRQRTSSGNRHPPPSATPVAGAHIGAARPRQRRARRRPARWGVAKRIPVVLPGADAPRSRVVAKLRSWPAGSWSAAARPPRSWAAGPAVRTP